MAQRTHAAGAAIAMAMPVMAMGTELQRTPSMAMPVPTATNDSPTQSGSTFHFVFMLFPDSRIAAGWVIRHQQTEPLVGVPSTGRGHLNAFSKGLSWVLPTSMYLCKIRFSG